MSHACELLPLTRIAARENFVAGAYSSDITLANWPQLDCPTGDPDDARELSLSFLHWLQAEQGLPGLRLRGDVVGTADGLAKALYVRESRRIVAEHTIVEHELGVAHADSVGIGSYRIDLHPRTGGEGYLDIARRRSRSRSGRSCPCAWRTCCPAPRTSPRRTSPTAAFACTRSSGTSAGAAAIMRRLAEPPRGVGEAAGPSGR